MIVATFFVPQGFDTEPYETKLAEVINKLGRKFVSNVFEYETDLPKDGTRAVLQLTVSEIEEGWQNRAVFIANAIRGDIVVVVNGRFVYDDETVASTAHF
ncbi:MAG: hypothetical protein BWY43_00565 [candidate division WS2 bacterium ADurb.Bin280]|uniref:Uncharacterized protein n=1 Tax=candidate division WS2 bacterium ADurb.Bin280 TaxID=1852829 RepID=A0A1V5SDK7_9BACT|nr:MAG: hypothetical protein BWY43_00565 [candidate division WS2 bacterium ADurb.Bin280]